MQSAAEQRLQQWEAAGQKMEGKSLKQSRGQSAGPSRTNWKPRFLRDQSTTWSPR